MGMYTSTIAIEFGSQKEYDEHGALVGEKTDGTCRVWHSMFPDIVGVGKQPHADRMAMLDLINGLAARLIEVTTAREQD